MAQSGCPVRVSGAGIGIGIGWPAIVDVLLLFAAVPAKCKFAKFC